MHWFRRWRAGVTLIELLCVIAILTILASMLVPTVMRAYNRVRDFAGEFDAGPIAEVLLKESRGYCTTHPRFRFTSKSDYVTQCGFSPKARGWVLASTTEFVPFTYSDHTNKIVLKVRIGRNKNEEFWFSKGDLSVWPVEQ